MRRTITGLPSTELRSRPIEPRTGHESQSASLTGSSARTAARSPLIWQSVAMPRVRPLDVPGLAWTAGAPVPVVVATEARSLFAYERESGDAGIAEFLSCVSLRFGFPNDEAQHGLAMWPDGLGFYAAHEAAESAWLDELRAIEGVHERAPAAPFATARHFILTFHDSTLEAIANEVVVVASAASVEQAVDVMATMVLPLP